MVENQIVRLSIKFRPLENILSPPYTSKVSKTILFSLLDGAGAEDILQRIESTQPQKPIIVTPIANLSDPTRRFLFKTVSSREKPIILGRGGIYEFYVTFTSSSIPLQKLIEALSPGTKLKLFTGEIIVEDTVFEVRSYESLGIKGGKVHITFMTPTLLSFPKEWVKIETPLRHSLLPIPCFIIWSLAQHWNIYASEKLKIRNVKRLAAYSNYALVELDYRLKPVTVVYDEKRRPRGFIGWTLYQHRRLRKKLSMYIEKLLEYANYVGVGRSRSIGFGVTAVRSIE
jgi:CRISPR-associated endoribonuclease Cas6